MKISGFSFIRNGLRYDYPFVESYQSILPLCDELVIAVGASDDGTRDALLALNEPKIKIIDTVWDETLREGGRILAQQTDVALDAVSGDWAFYIQGDEVVHQDDLPAIRGAMARHLHNPKVEGLLFDYLHFYGSYHYVGAARRWYRREIRVVRPRIGVRSWRDAQGFRIDGQKLFVKPANARIFHYGWARPPETMQQKTRDFHRLWHNDEWIAAQPAYNYQPREFLKLFNHTHPAVMRDRVARMDWRFEPDLRSPKLSLKEKLSGLLEQATGYRFGEYKNYKLI